MYFICSCLFSFQVRPVHRFKASSLYCAWRIFSWISPGASIIVLKVRTLFSLRPYAIYSVSDFSIFRTVKMTFFN